MENVSWSVGMEKEKEKFPDLRCILIAYYYASFDKIDILLLSIVLIFELGISYENIKYAKSLEKVWKYVYKIS